MRRGTLITIVILVIALAVATWIQLRSGEGDRRFPGGPTPPPASTPDDQ